VDTQALIHSHHLEVKPNCCSILNISEDLDISSFSASLILSRILPSVLPMLASKFSEVQVLLEFFKQIWLRLRPTMITPVESRLLLQWWRTSFLEHKNFSKEYDFESLLLAWELSRDDLDRGLGVGWTPGWRSGLLFKNDDQMLERAELPFSYFKLRC